MDWTLFMLGGFFWTAVFAMFLMFYLIENKINKK